MKKERERTVKTKRRNAFLQTMACVMLENAVPRSYIAKALKKRQIKKLHLVVEENEKQERENKVQEKQEHNLKLFKTGNLCQVFNKGRVRTCCKFA